ncbi:hypothetical protein PSTG_12173 [Puccinia striiformis f. sp. tritici PST-78]|uniref:Uncharacterized protein n=1 Tax=Puccinia striiformis f. sp. tritici PST-78 TaxID=1165861 RepID=A0A0L0V5I3_9BASI|nr:hypothetical protein PSTG_12173 [Puccinia striiformis f. sp. tritici PST-78]
MTTAMLNRNNPEDLDGLKEQLQEMGGLIIDRFEDIIFKYELDRTGFIHPQIPNRRPVIQPYIHVMVMPIQPTFNGPVFDHLKKDLLRHIQFNFLPLLEHQITHLSTLLEPSRLLLEAHQTLQLISGVQDELHRTLENLTSTLAIFTETTVNTTDYTSGDRHREGLKIFRLCGMNKAIRQVLDEVCSFIERCIACIKFAQLSPRNTRIQIRYRDIEIIRQEAIRYTHNACQGIKLTTKWLERSELELIQIQWPMKIKDLHQKLRYTLELINSPGEIGHNRLQSPIAIHLAQSLIPTIKLVRLFFVKLSSTFQIHHTKGPLSVYLSSSELQYSSQSAHSAGRLIDTILGCLIDQPVSTFHLTSATNRLRSQFESHQLLILLYVIPLIPENGNTLKDWFATWFNLFLLTTEKLNKVAKNVV